MRASRQKEAILSTGAPYSEKADRRENKLDVALLNAWGRAASTNLFSRVEIARHAQFVRRAECKEKQLLALSDRRFRQAAEELRGRLLSASTSDELSLAFALAREAARRHVGMRHFHVQLLGGAAMMSGAIAEMQTGEGKTLTAVLPAVAAALMGRCVHIVTVNDYLARRDFDQLRGVFIALGLSVGLIEPGQPHQARQRAYACDVTYCTNKDIAFDYLRGRLALGRRGHTGNLVNDFLRSTPSYNSGHLLRGLDFAIIDEADSVLVDEARTPLILAGVQEADESDPKLYEAVLDLARALEPENDFRVVLNEKAIRLTAHGERLLAERTSRRHGLLTIRRAREELVQKALTALHLFHRDIEYIVTQGKVQIVDEFTGRVMPDRSWEHGLHQLIEAKEGCQITGRRDTLARITYQRFFRRYLHLCGMTGTAVETAGELHAVYGLRVVRIPTNRPLRRTGLGARLFTNAALKWNAVVDTVRTIVQQNCAVLIGTRSVDASEHVKHLLRQAGLEPVILNARQDQQEAEIVAAAGRPGRITVATNMAGRGTDIQLHPAVKEAGGLHVILTEYHELRRIDRQLFGRVGRQGDPGSYEFIVSLDDELFARFASKTVRQILANAVWGGPKISSVVGLALRAYSQAAAERLHARTRRMTLAEDHRLSKILGFAGKE